MDVGIIDRFFDVFSHYIDSGFGLLHGEVFWLTGILIVIDIALAALFWALTASGSEDVIARLIKKVLYVGAFAFIINNFNTLSNIIFHSFAGLGLTASGSTMTEADLLRPGHVASVGLDAARPLLTQMGDLIGPVGFFANFEQIMVLAVSWLVVLAAFFILAVQMFITLIEFKLTTLAGFVLIPFALWGKSAFLSERVLGNVMSSGVKVLVLAVIVGIGTTIFSSFIPAPGSVFTNDECVATILGALALLGLSLFGTGIAAGLVSGAPPLGGGAAAGTVMAAGGVISGAASGARLAGGALLGTGRTTVAGVKAYRNAAAASGKSGMGAVGAGLAGVARATGSGIADRVRTRFSADGSGASRPSNLSRFGNSVLQAAGVMRAGHHGGSSSGPSLSR